MSPGTCNFWKWWVPPNLSDSQWQCYRNLSDLSTKNASLPDQMSDKTGMEISGRPFARGDRIYDRANRFKSEVAHLASWLDYVNAWKSFILQSNIYRTPEYSSISPMYYRLTLDFALRECKSAVLFMLQKSSMAAPSYGLLPSMASGGVVVEALSLQSKRCGVRFPTSPLQFQILMISQFQVAILYGWNGSGWFRPFYLFALGCFSPGQFALRALKWHKTSKQ